MTARPVEPPNRSTVVWRRDGEPYAVFHRADDLAEDGTCRWVNADQYKDPDSEPMSWAELCDEMTGLDGPYLVTLDPSGVAS